MENEKKDQYQILNQQFQKIFAKINFQHNQVMNFSNCCMQGFNQIISSLHANNYDYVLSEMPKYFNNIDNIVKQYGSFENFAAEFSAGMTQDTINQSLIVMEYSAIVLMHCILDISLFELIQLTSEQEKDYWANKSDKNEIQYKEFMKDDRETIIARRLKNRVNRCERESVIVKCKYLLEICNTIPKEDVINDYAFNLELLERYDNMRHKLIHNSFKAFGKDDAGIIVEYFRKTALFFCLLIRRKYDFKIDLIEIQNIIREITQQPFFNVSIKRIRKQGGEENTQN